MANPVRVALADALAEDSPLAALVGTRIYFQDAPQGATYPLVIFHKQAGNPRRFADLHALQDDVWTVRGVTTGTTSATKAEEIAAAIDAALDNVEIPITGRDTVSLLRESDVDYGEIADGKLYRNCGAMYRLRSE